MQSVTALKTQLSPGLPVARPGQPDARSIVEPQAAAWLLLGRHLQSFPSPDALDPIFAHIPARLIEHDRDPAVAVATVRLANAIIAWVS